MSVQVILPDERADQLRQLATSLNVSMADAVGVLLNRAIADGLLPDEVPGVTVKRKGKTVHVDLGAFAQAMPVPAAKDLADRLLAFADPKQSQVAALTERVRGLNADLLDSLKIVRRGAAIKIVNPEGHEKTVSRSIAADIARAIGKAAQ